MKDDFKTYWLDRDGIILRICVAGTPEDIAEQKKRHGIPTGLRAAKACPAKWVERYQKQLSNDQARDGRRNNYNPAGDQLDGIYKDMFLRRIRGGKLAVELEALDIQDPALKKFLGSLVHAIGDLASEADQQLTDILSVKKRYKLED